MELATNGVVITDAIKYVNGKLDHLNKQEKEILQDIKGDTEDEDTTKGEGLEEQETHNGIF
jgi:hypothetical protein